MILFKVYSKKKLLRIFFLCILIIVFLGMMFFYTRNLQERAIFNVISNEIILIISPSDPARVYINGKEVEEKRVVDEKTPYIHKMQANESVDIKIEPIEDKVPVEKTLNFQEGRLSLYKEESFWNSLSINEWPNQVYEIYFDLHTPTKIEMTDDESLIKEERIDLDQDNHLERVQLIKQGDHYFMQVDDREKIILKDYREEKFKWIIEDINQDGAKEIVIRGSFGKTNEYIEIFQFDQGEIKRIFWEHGDDIALFPDGRILVGNRLYDTVDHYQKTFYKWRENTYQEENIIINWWQGKVKWPTTPQDTLKAFFEAYELGLMEEAKGYLTEEHQNDQGVENIIGQIDKGWIDIKTPKYYFLEGYGENESIYMAFYYDTNIHSKYKEVKIYEINLEKLENIQGSWKIKNIRQTKNYSYGL